jgi:hypothetical protein
MVDPGFHASASEKVAALAGRRFMGAAALWGHSSSFRGWPPQSRTPARSMAVPLCPYHEPARPDEIFPY